MTEKKKIKVAVFDNDGTILDSSHRGFENTKLVAEGMGIEVSSEKEKSLKKHWGHPTKDVFRLGLELAGEMLEKFHSAFEAEDAKKPHQLVSGAKEALQKSREFGIINAMLTARTEENINQNLTEQGIREYFDFVFGMDSSNFHKPDPRAFEIIFERCGVSPAEIVFIGDTPVDFACGVGAGVETLAVLTSFHTREDARAHGIREENILYSVADFPAWLEKRNGSNEYTL